MTGNLPGTTLPLPEGQQDALFTVLGSNFLRFPPRGCCSPRSPS